MGCQCPKSLITLRDGRSFLDFAIIQIEVGPLLLSGHSRGISEVQRNSRVSSASVPDELIQHRRGNWRRAEEDGQGVGEAVHAKSMPAHIRRHGNACTGACGRPTRRRVGIMRLDSLYLPRYVQVVPSGPWEYFPISGAQRNTRRVDITRP